MAGRFLRPWRIRQRRKVRNADWRNISKNIARLSALFPFPGSSFVLASSPVLSSANRVPRLIFQPTCFFLYNDRNRKIHRIRRITLHNRRSLIIHTPFANNSSNSLINYTFFMTLELSRRSKRLVCIFSSGKFSGNAQVLFSNVCVYFSYSTSIANARNWCV